MSDSENDYSLYHILEELDEADKQKEADKNKISGKLHASINDPLSETLDINHNPPSNDNPASPTHHLSLREVLLKLGPKIAEAYDEQVVTASWQELECRSISGKHSAAKQTLAPYLLENNNMWFGTKRDQQGKNARVLHCPICKKFRVPLVCVFDNSKPKKFLHFKLNKKHQRHNQHIEAKCKCVDMEQQNMFPAGTARKKMSALSQCAVLLFSTTQKSDHWSTNSTSSPFLTCRKK